MTNKELFQKFMPKMGTKLSARIDKQDENIINIQMSQMSLEKKIAQVANSLNFFPQVRCLVILSQTQSNCMRYVLDVSCSSSN